MVDRQLIRTVASLCFLFVVWIVGLYLLVQTTRSEGFAEGYAAGHRDGLEQRVFSIDELPDTLRLGVLETYGTECILIREATP